MIGSTAQAPACEMQAFACPHDAAGDVAAVLLLDSTITDGLPPLVALRVTHARDRLARRAETYLFGGTSRVPDTERQFMAMLKTVALELESASQSLLVAADALKRCGKGVQANHAYLAHRKAQDAAAQLVSS